MTRATNPEFEKAYKIWTLHLMKCVSCQKKDFCNEGSTFRMDALVTVSSVWRGDK